MDELANLTPWQQLRAPRLGRRLTQLVVGLVLFGASLGMLVRAGLGLAPWDVFHQGVARWLPLSFGTIVIATSVLVLLAWVPLRQMPGVATVANAVVVGLAADATLAVLSPPDLLVGRVALLVGGVLLNAAAGALYIGAQLGTGPRDGLMTGLARRTGWSLRFVRTALELGVLAAGVLLGGTVGLGTVVYALGIGPLLQRMLPAVVVPLTPPEPRSRDPYRDWLLDDRLQRGPGRQALTVAWR